MYDRLQVHLVDRGESFYQERMKVLMKELIDKGRLMVGKSCLSFKQGSLLCKIFASLMRACVASTPARPAVLRPVTFKMLFLLWKILF